MNWQKDPYLDARLLSRKRSLTAQEKESVIESILEKHSLKERRRGLDKASILGLKRRVAWVVLLALLTIPVGIMLLGERAEDEFRVKGEGNDAPFFTVSCLDSSGKTACREGARLTFRLHSPKENQYFSAFIRRDSDGLIIWCFPIDETGKSISLKDLGVDGVLPRGMAISDVYEPGRYEVFGVLSTTPFDRQTIRNLVDEKKRSDDVEITQVSFKVE